MAKIEPFMNIFHPMIQDKKMGTNKKEEKTVKPKIPSLNDQNPHKIEVQNHFLSYCESKNEGLWHILSYCEDSKRRKNR